MEETLKDESDEKIGNCKFEEKISFLSLLSYHKMRKISKGWIKLYSANDTQIRKIVKDHTLLQSCEPKRLLKAFLWNSNNQLDSPLRVTVFLKACVSLVLEEKKVSGWQNYEPCVTYYHIV